MRLTAASFIRSDVGFSVKFRMSAAYLPSRSRTENLLRVLRPAGYFWVDGASLGACASTKAFRQKDAAQCRTYASFAAAGSLDLGSVTSSATAKVRP
jgi:hypothetical protein